MKPEEFKQNVKDRVRVFEDGGIRLLKKGKRVRPRWPTTCGGKAAASRCMRTRL